MTEPESRAAINKQIIRDYWSAIIGGRMEEMLSYIDDEAKLQTIGDMGICGFRTKADYIAAMLVMSRSLDGPGTVKLGEIVCEGDIVVVEAEGFYRTKDGRDYNGQYIYVYYLKGGKIIGLKEYSDSLHSYEIFVNELTRGPRKKRESNIWNNSATLLGTVSVAEAG